MVFPIPFDQELYMGMKTRPATICAVFEPTGLKDPFTVSKYRKNSEIVCSRKKLSIKSGMSEFRKIYSSACHRDSDSSGSSAEEEPRTMGDLSFEEWKRTMAGLNDRVIVDGNGTIGELSPRIPTVSSRWAYENWRDRMDGTNTGGDRLPGRTGFPLTRSTRIPIPVPFTGYSRPSRFPVPTGETQNILVPTGHSRPSRIPVRTGQTRDYSACQPCLYRNCSTRRTGTQPSRIPVPISGRGFRRDVNHCTCSCHSPY
jgi:hypothetical protein